MKIARTIAMLLVLVMIAGSFTSCFTVMLGIAAAGDEDWGYAVLGGLLIDVFIIGGIGGIVALVMLLVDAEPPNRTETEFYLANAEYNFFTQNSSAIEKFNSLPEAERVALMEKINSLPETKRASLIRTVSSLPETELATSFERINALSEEELTSVLEKFGALNESEMDLLEEKLNERAMYLPGGVAFVQ